MIAQLLNVLPRRDFSTCVERYGSKYKCRGFSCRDQFLAIAFAQLTYRESLRDIEICLRALGTKLYHPGFRYRISSSTMADANQRRDWRNFADFAHILIRRARVLDAKNALAVDLEQTAYALDSTTIELCLSLFPWARLQSTKAGVKLHTLLDLRGNTACFVHISLGKMHDVDVVDRLLIEPAAFYVMDRAYLDYRRLRRFTSARACFVTRANRNFLCEVRENRPVDRGTGLRSDHTIVLEVIKTASLYPEPLRRVAFYDVEHKRRPVFLTNSFARQALTIAGLYKSRWQIELFFMRIKQHLLSKAFFGTSENAAKTQIWIAINAYVLVAIVKKELGAQRSL